MLYKLLFTSQLIVLSFYIFFNRLRPFLNAGGGSISSKKILTNETFKIKIGFEAKINIIAKVKIEVDKFSTVN